MRFRAHPEAEQELAAALLHYENAVPGLGADFLGEFEHGIAQIREHPMSCPVILKSARKYLLRRFPYALIYIPSQDEIVLYAAMHTSRKPFYWKDRLTN